MNWRSTGRRRKVLTEFGETLVLALWDPFDLATRGSTRLSGQLLRIVFAHPVDGVMEGTRNAGDGGFLHAPASGLHGFPGFPLSGLVLCKAASLILATAAARTWIISARIHVELLFAFTAANAIGIFT